MTLNNPFYSRPKRIKWYIIIIVTLSIVIFLLLFFTFRKLGTNLMNYDSRSNKGLTDFFSFYSLFVSIFTIFPAVLVMKRLFLKGTSNDLRQKLLYRHVIYIVLYMFIIWAILFDLFEWGNST